jgi:hypothetical protein
MVARTRGVPAGGRPDQAAQAEFLERYVGAIYRYSLRMLEDPDLATEACQEFALRFVRGDFHRDESAALGVTARELEPRACREPGALGLSRGAAAAHCAGA